MKKLNIDELYDNFNGIVCLFDSNDVITYANKRFANLLGYMEGELLGININELIVPNEKSAFFNIFYFEKTQKESTVKFYHRSGAYRFFSVKIYTLPNQNQIIGHLIQRTFKSYDVEENSEVNKMIEKVSEIMVDDLSKIISNESADLTLVLDYLPIDIWIKDKYHRYIFTNKAIVKHTNITSDEFYMKDDFDIYDNDIANDFLATDQAAIDAKEKISFIFKAGSSKLIEWTEVTKIPVYNDKKEYIGMIGFAVDLSELKHVEKSLEAQKERLQFIVENVQGMVFEIDEEGALIFSAGHLITELDINTKNLNIIEHYKNVDKNDELVEKLKLALNGESTKLSTIINNIKLELYFNSKVDSKGNFSVLGYGNKIK